MRGKIANFLSLVIIQGSNAIVPVILFPFSLSVVGPDYYSKIVLAEAITMFLVTAVLYSFEIDGVAEVVGLHPKRDTEEISKVFSCVIYVRLVLFMFGAPIALSVAWIIDSTLFYPALCWLLVPLSYAIQPSWLYQGLQFNTPVAVVTVFSRILTLMIILLFLEKGHDYLMVPLVLGVSSLGVAGVTFFYATHRLGLNFVKITHADFIKVISHGKEVFFANIGVGLYRDANILILSMLGASGASISAYSIAEKIVKLLQAVIRPLNQLYFPAAIVISRSAGSPGREAFWRLFGITWPQLLVMSLILVLTSFGYVYFNPYISFLGGIDNRNAVAFLILIMCFATFFGIGNFMLGIVGLSNLGERRYLFFAVVGTGIANVIVNVLLVFYFEAIGAAIGFVLAEVLLFFLISRRYFPSLRSRDPICW